MLKFQRRIIACLILCYVTRLTAGNEGNSSACAPKESNIIQWKARIENCLTNLSACLLEEGLNEDIDECHPHNICDKSATCNNTMGSFTCTCDNGYSGNGVTCFDINECESQNGICHDDSYCLNWEGSYRCVCNAGYTGDRNTCIDVDDCQKLFRKNALCSANQGSVMCRCGTDDGRTCIDIDECEIVENCQTNSDSNFCLNWKGSYICKTTYIGEKNTCVGVFRPMTCLTTADRLSEGYHLISCPSYCSNYRFSFWGVFSTNNFHKNSSICASAKKNGNIEYRGGNAILYKSKSGHFFFL